MWTKKLTDQLNLAHVARKNIKQKKLKQTKRQGSVKAVQKESKRLWMKGSVKEVSFKSEVKGRGSDESLYYDPAKNV